MIRAITGILALGVVFGTAALLDPPPEPLAHRKATTTAVLPADLPIGCFGWMELPVGDAGENEGGLAPGTTEVSRTVLVPSGNPVESIGFGIASDAAIGVQVEHVSRGDLSGLAAAACSRPRTDAWLVGGSTHIGSSARLVLVNPSHVIVEVAATIYGPTGAVDQSVIVSMGPRSSEAFLLEGIAAELSTLVVHVEADGAGIVSAIQDSRLDGFLPAGSEWVVAGMMPTMRLVIPGVGPSDPRGGDGPATVRLMAPEGASASLTLIDTAGKQPWPGTGIIRLEPGIPIDLDVPASPRSIVIVEADNPVVAAAISRKARVPEEGLEGDLARDLLWVLGQDPHRGSSLTAVIPPYTVTVVAYADAQGVFRVRDATTGVVLAEKVMGAGTMVELPLEADPGTVIAIEGDLAWALMVEDQGLITAVQPVDIHDTPIDISVVPGPYVPSRAPA